MLLVAAGAFVAAQQNQSQSTESASSQAEASSEAQDASGSAGSADESAEGQAGGSDAAESVDEEELTFAEEGTAQQGQDASVSSFGVWDLVRMVLVLSAVVGAIYLIFHFLKRTASGRYGNTRLMRHLGSLTLPGNKLIHLVEVGRQVFLVGSGDNGVHLISEVTDQETIDEIRLAAAEEQQHGGRRTFSEMLQGVFASSGSGGAHGAPGDARARGASGGYGTGVSPAEPPDSGSSAPAAQSSSHTAGFDFLKEQRERLKRL
jgi:flagellar biogenesis protein FliO